MPGERARAELSGTRFADVRWVAETGSTNADAIELGRAGAGEGLVVVADHQTRGRGRQGRPWVAPPRSSLLVSVVLRPPAPLAPVVMMAVAVAMAEAVEQVAGFAPRLKWPNDLVWPGDGSSADRKLGGILAESDWTSSADQRPLVVVGAGVNVEWPAVLPPELDAEAVAINHIRSAAVDRETLLVAFLRRLDRQYGRLLRTGDTNRTLGEWRRRSATLGRPVRVDMGAYDIVGLAIDVSEDGHLVVETDEGAQRIVSAGDVTHLRVR